LFQRACQERVAVLKRVAQIGGAVNFHSGRDDDDEEATSRSAPPMSPFNYTM
jgi:hypothetical protein